MEGRVCGMMALGDTPRPESAAVVRALQDAGVEVFMVTGDQEKAAKCIAGQVGVRPGNVLAGVTPAGKIEKVRELQQRRGLTVAMVGDGVNDAPALAQADVGVAVGCGTDVALESASVVLVHNDLRDVLTAMDLARTVFRRIKLNFVWAFGYNLLMIPFVSHLLHCVLFTSLSLSLSLSIAICLCFPLEMALRVCVRN